MKIFILYVLLLSFFIGGFAQAHNQSKSIPYYGHEFYQALGSGVQDDQLKEALQTVLLNYHQTVAGDLDQIVNFCDGEGCYWHESLGYDRSRIFLFGQFYLTDFHNGTYGIRDVYCDNLKVTNDFKKGKRPGPDMMPEGSIINVEHTWPQSRFSSDFDKDMQKSDIHHLYPADTRMNAARANLPFGEVSDSAKKLKCPVSRVGNSARHTVVFEPPMNHKGNVARAMFYFSVRYSLPIAPEQEEALRKWNLEDPVDEEEILRNDAIQHIQGNRNPFIDYPALADSIADF